MRIILGVFEDSYETLKSMTDSIGFWDFVYSDYSSIDWEEYLDSKLVSHEIINMVVLSDEIVFDLTNIYFPFPVDSPIPVTLCELDFIFRYNFINKTTFYVNGKIVEKEKIVKLWEMREQPITFGSIY